MKTLSPCAGGGPATPKGEKSSQESCTLTGVGLSAPRIGGEGQPKAASATAAATAPPQGCRFLSRSRLTAMLALRSCTLGQGIYQHQVISTPLILSLHWLILSCYCPWQLVLQDVNVPSIQELHAQGQSEEWTRKAIPRYDTIMGR